MRESAIERELRGLASNFKFGLHGHDRGVLIGLALACIPIPPMCVLGLLVTLWNLKLWKEGKLELHERNIICLSVICGFLSNLLAGFLLAKAWVSFSQIDASTSVFLEQLFQQYKAILIDIASGIGEFFGSLKDGFDHGNNKDSGRII